MILVGGDEQEEQSRYHRHFAACGRSRCGVGSTLCPEPHHHLARRRDYGELRSTQAVAHRRSGDHRNGRHLCGQGNFRFLRAIYYCAAQAHFSRSPGHIAFPPHGLRAAEHERVRFRQDLYRRDDADPTGDADPAEPGHSDHIQQRGGEILDQNRYRGERRQRSAFL